jgi:hypothetical protein
LEDELMKNTPGPWRYNPDFDEIQADNGLGIPILAKIERGGDDRPDGEEATRNALLMAAAPELLACLEALLYDQPESGTVTVTIGWMTLEQIRRVIKVAREGDYGYQMRSREEERDRAEVEK